jgi:mycothiol synthase
MIRTQITVADAPAISGLVFRPFAGKSDYPAVVEIINARNVADHIEWVCTLEGLAHEYAHLSNCDPSTDMLMAEVEGRAIGCARVWWWINDEGERLYGLTGQVHPQWRGRGIGRALLGWQEQRLREIAASQPTTGPRYFQTFALERCASALALLKHAGYIPVRYSFLMVRPNLALEGVPDAPSAWPLPEGLEVRPVLAEHRRLIWEALEEAFRDHWGYSPGTEEDYQGFLNWPDAQPHLWQVAWDRRTNEVAGMVLNQIFARENEKFGQRRGWTEPIAVRRPWRRQGLARALIMRSLRLLREQGMTEAALGVDAENLNKALQLYESCGYRAVQRNQTLRKPL